MITGRREPAVGLLRGPVEFQYLPGANQKYRICTLVAESGRIKQDRRVVLCGVREQSVQASSESVQLSQIEWAIVQKEIPIDKLVIDIEADDGVFLIGIGRVEEGIANQNLLILQVLFKSTEI